MLQFSFLLAQKTMPNLKATQMHLQYVNQFANTTNSLPNLDFDNRSLQILGHIWNLHDTQIFTVYWCFRFVLPARSKFTLHVCMVYIFDNKFRISERICGNCISMPIFKHYKYITVFKFSAVCHVAPSHHYSSMNYHCIFLLLLVVLSAYSERL